MRKLTLVFLLSSLLVVLASSLENFWDVPSAWPNNQVPGSNEDIVVSSNITIRSDIIVKTITVQKGAILKIAYGVNISITAHWIMVDGGRFEWGTEEKPYRNKGILTLLGTAQDSIVTGFGTKFLGAKNYGVISIHGKKRSGWAQLANHAFPNNTNMILDHCVDWVPGDQIVLLSSDVDWLQREELTVVSSDGCGNITFYPPLVHRHQGEYQLIEGHLIDERAEVILLTRNIVVQGDELSTSQRFGAQIRANMGEAGPGALQISGVEIYRGGQGIDEKGEGLLGRYPYHMHMIEEGGANCYIKDSSIHVTFSRCTTIHNTHLALIQNNIMYNFTGHCVFMEDGPEFGNRVIGNIVVGGSISPKPLIDSETFDGGSFAAFWIVNPNNTYHNNRAAGGKDGFGFWFQLPSTVSGDSYQLPRYAGLNPSAAPVPWDHFVGNVMHSWMTKRNGQDFLSACGIFSQTFSAFVNLTFRDSFFYKSSVGAWQSIYSDSPPYNKVTFLNCTFIDNSIGVFQGGITKDCLFIRQSLNPIAPYLIRDFGFVSQFFRKSPSAFFVYDGRVFSVGSTFIDFGHSLPGVAPHYNEWEINVGCLWPRGAQGLQNYFMDNKFIRSRPAVLSHWVDLSARNPDTSIQMVGSNTDENGNDMGMGYITWNQTQLINSNCLCENLDVPRYDGYGAQTCWCPFKQTKNANFIYLNTWPLMIPKGDHTDAKAENVGAGGKFVNDLGQVFDLNNQWNWLGNFDASNPLITHRGYHFQFNYNGFYVPAFRFEVFVGSDPTFTGFPSTSFPGDWVKMSIYYPYKDAKVWISTMLLAITSSFQPSSLNSTVLSSVDELNSKTDIDNLYNYHDLDTGLMYIHIPVKRSIRLFITKHVYTREGGGYDLPDWTGADTAEYYEPPVPGGNNPSPYPSLKAVSPVAEGNPTTSFADFSMGRDGPDPTKYKSFPGSTAKTPLPDEEEQTQNKDKEKETSYASPTNRGVLNCLVALLFVAIASLF